MAKLVTRALPAATVLAVLAIVSTLGTGIFPAADRSATVLLGGQAVGPHRDRLRAGLAHAFAMRAHGSGLAGDVRIYLDAGSRARAVTVGIYSDARGYPGELLSYGFDPSPKARSWRTVRIASMHVVSGRTYWLALLGEGGTLRFRAGRAGAAGRDGRCSSSPAVQADLHRLPRRWSPGSARVGTGCPISAYVLAAGAAGAVPALSPSGSSPSSSPSQSIATASPADPKPSEADPKSTEEKQKEAKAKEEKAEEEKIDEEKKAGMPKDCFENPETEGSTRFEACGYPGPKDTGVLETGSKTECSALPEYTGSRSISAAKTKIEGKLVKIDLGSGESGFDVDAAEVTFNKDCLLVSGDGREGPVIKDDEHGSSLLFENSTIRAEGPKLPYSYEKAVDNSRGISPGWKIENARIEDCGECVSGFGEISKSYVISNEYVGEESHGLHREDWYLNDETASVRESTIFNPSDQTSDIFMDSNNGAGAIACDDQLTVENSLLAGGGTSIEMCGKDDTAGTSSLKFTDNRIPRCLTTPIVKNSGGEEDCSGKYFEGGDRYGYMPHGGADGVAAFEDVGTVTWSGNYWDDDLAALAKP